MAIKSKHHLTVYIFLFLVIILCGSTYARFIALRSSPDILSDGVNRFAAETSTCDETHGFLPTTTSVLGNIFLIAVYGFLMFIAAKSLSNGSELLLQILGPGVIGGLFLPILGALPDAILILVSGLSESTGTAQSLVSVGMGLLAGSTVMLLTVIWGSCVIVGKCDLDSVARIPRDTMGFSLTESGICTDIRTSYAAIMMVISVIPFLVVQIPQYLNSTSERRSAILIGLIVSLLLLVSYCLYQVLQPWIQERKVDYVKRKRAILELPKRNQSEEVVEGVEKSKRKAVLLLWLGTLIAVAFADPLVVSVNKISDATSIPAFFISFITLPLATNSYKAVSAIIFASRDKRRTASLTLSSLTLSELYGTATMNNVLCLSVFLALVYIRGLTWDFSAEVLVILIVCLVMGLLGSLRTHFPLWTAISAILLYPLSLALVYVLDYVLGWQ